MLAIFAMALQPLADPDAFWHLATGRHMYATRTIPKLDPFSWSATDRPWVAHEWLTESIIWPLWRIGGDAILIVAFALMITGAFALAWRTAERLGASRGVASALVLFGALASRHTFNVRPQMVSLLLTAWIAGTLLAPGKSPRLRFWYPIVLGFWANMHGGFFLGLLLVVGTALVEVVHLLGAQWKSRKTEARGPRLTRYLRPILIGTASVGASAANPNEVQGLIYPLRYVREFQPMMRLNAEWQTPAIGAFLPFYLLLVLIPCAAYLARRRPTLLEACFMALMSVLGVSAVRNTPVYCVVLIPLAAAWLTEAFRRHQQLSKARAPRARRALAARPLPTGILRVSMVASLVVGGGLTASGATTAREATSQVALFPSTTLSALQQLQAKARGARVFNAHDFGGWLIWNRVSVSMDGRTDMYGVQLFEKYYATWAARAGWEHRLNDDNVQFVLVEFNAPLARALRNEAAKPNAEWTLAATDPVAVLYRRKGSVPQQTGLVPQETGLVPT